MVVKHFYLVFLHYQVILFIDNIADKAGIINDSIKEHDEERGGDEEKKEISDSTIELAEDERIEKRRFDITTVIFGIVNGC